MTVPCGTPDRTRSPSIRLREWDLMRSTRTHCVRPNRNSEIQLEVLHSMPYRQSFRMSFWWSTTSKALEKSSMPASTSSLWSHRENSPGTQTSPEPTLLSWGGGPREKFPPHPWPHGKPGLIALIGPLRPYCSQSPLILLRCVMEIKFAQNLRWLGNWH